MLIENAICVEVFAFLLRSWFQGKPSKKEEETFMLIKRERHTHTEKQTETDTDRQTDRQ